MSSAELSGYAQRPSPPRAAEGSGEENAEVQTKPKPREAPPPRLCPLTSLARRRQSWLRRLAALLPRPRSCRSSSSRPRTSPRSASASWRAARPASASSRERLSCTSSSRFSDARRVTLRGGRGPKHHELLPTTPQEAVPETLQEREVQFPGRDLVLSTSLRGRKDAEATSSPSSIPHTPRHISPSEEVRIETRLKLPAASLALVSLLPPPIQDFPSQILSPANNN